MLMDSPLEGNPFIFSRDTESPDGGFGPSPGLQNESCDEGFPTNSIFFGMVDLLIRIRPVFFPITPQVSSDP